MSDEAETVDPIADPNKITTIADLNIALNNLAARFKEATVRPKPRYVLDGQEFDWTTYLRMLTDGMEALIKLRQMFGRPRAVWLGTKRTRRTISSYY